jgi:hypothetical protein
MLTDLELYLYSDRYGPTNEKLGRLPRRSFRTRIQTRHHPLRPTSTLPRVATLKARGNPIRA